MVTGKEYEETLEKVKFSGITWTHDNKVWYPIECETFKVKLLYGCFLGCILWVLSWSRCRACHWQRHNKSW